MKKKKMKKQTVAFIVALLFTQQGLAFANQETDPYSMDSVLVTATRYLTRDVDIPAATEIFTKQKIEEMGAQNAMEVIQNIPGFTLTASPTGNTYVGFRGMAKDNVLILINGIPLNQEGNYDLESISSAAIERIEVVKGGSSVLYGTMASAGVVNIIMKKNLPNRIVVGAGDMGQKKATANMQIGKLGIIYDHLYSQNRGKIYQSSPTAFYTGDKLNRDSMNLRYDFDKHLNLQYMYTEKISDATQWNAVTNKILSSFHSVVKYNGGQLNYTNNDLKITAFGRNRDWQFNTTTHQQGSNVGLDVQNKWVFDKYSLIAGGYYENEEAENINNGVWFKNSRKNIAAFARVETDLSKQTKLFFGAREAFIENAGTEFCPQLQILHKLNVNESLYTNINKSFRAPTLSEQYGFSATQLINPDLRPESGWSYEIGWKKQLDPSRLVKLDVYHMQIHDRIYSAKQNDKTIYLNAPSYKNTGVEVSYEQKLNNRYSWGLAASYSDPMQQNSASTAWERTDYRLGISANIGYSYKKFLADIYANYVGMRAGDVSPLLNVNLLVRYKVSKQDSVYLKVNNLLNREDFRTATGSLLEQRNWMLSYEHAF